MRRSRRTVELAVEARELGGGRSRFAFVDALAVEQLEPSVCLAHGLRGAQRARCEREREERDDRERGEDQPRDPVTPLTLANSGPLGAASTIRQVELASGVTT